MCILASLCVVCVRLCQSRNERTKRMTSQTREQEAIRERERVNGHNESHKSASGPMSCVAHVAGE